MDAVARDRRDFETIEAELLDYADDDLSEEEKDQERELLRKSRNMK